MILPRANNGMQLVCSIVHFFNGIVSRKLFKCIQNLKACFLEERLTPFQKVY